MDIFCRKLDDTKIIVEGFSSLYIQVFILNPFGDSDKVCILMRKDEAKSVAAAINRFADELADV